MRLLCLTKEPEFVRQVSTAFPEEIVETECQERPEGFLDSAKTGNWNFFLVDFDALQSDVNPLDLVKKLGLNTRLLVIGSSSFANWHHELQRMGAMVLHKPATVGEIGLALRKLAAPRARGAR